MRDGPADKLDVGHFVHPETVSVQGRQIITQLVLTWYWGGERRRSRRADRRPSWRTAGSASGCSRSSWGRLARARSSKTEPAEDNLQVWPHSTSYSCLTAALETTVFWSHSINTSRNVTFLRSMACRTFPGRFYIINQVSGQVKWTTLDKTGHYKTLKRTDGTELKVSACGKVWYFSNLRSALELFQSSPVSCRHT